MDGTLSTKEFVSADIDPSLTPRCIPIDEAVEKKLMIVRPELRHWQNARIVELLYDFTEKYFHNYLIEVVQKNRGIIQSPETYQDIV